MASTWTGSSQGFEKIEEKEFLFHKWIPEVRSLTGTFDQLYFDRLFDFDLLFVMLLVMLLNDNRLLHWFNNDHFLLLVFLLVARFLVVICGNNHCRADDEEQDNQFSRHDFD